MNRKTHKKPEEKSRQKRRTYRNQTERYERALKERPHDPHKKKWEGNIAYYAKAQ